MRETSEERPVSAALSSESSVAGIVCMHQVGALAWDGIVCMHRVGGPSSSEVEGIACMHHVVGQRRASVLDVGGKQRRRAEKLRKCWSCLKVLSPKRFPTKSAAEPHNLVRAEMLSSALCLWRSSAVYKWDRELEKPHVVLKVARAERAWGGPAAYSGRWC